MRVLFVKSVINSYPYSFDIGIASLSAMLKQHGYDVDLFIFRNRNNYKLLQYRIENTKPDVIAFSVYCSSFTGTIQISNFIRKKYPKINQVMGGIHIILNPDDIVRAPNIDAVCVGEGEYAFIEYLKRLQKHNQSHIYTPGFWTRKGNTIIKNPTIPFIEDINALPLPDRELFSTQLLSHDNFYNIPTLGYVFTRGCPFNCSYCSNHSLRSAFKNQKYVRHMSPERAIEWIKSDLKKYACEHIRIHDDTFTIDKQWVNKFLDLYKTIKIPFSCNVRVGTFDKKLLTKMIESGLNEVSVGVESGDENLRRLVMRRNISNQEIINTFTMIKALKLKSLAFLMIGIPEETPKYFINTINLVAKLSPESYILAIFHPYQGTDLYSYIKQKKWNIRKQPSNYIERLDTILDMPNFSRQDILYYFHNFDKLLYFAKNRISPFSKIHRSIIFYLLAIPPSTKLFPIAQFLSGLDNILFYIIQTLKDKSNLFTHHNNN